jgi:hypothetical protein
MIYFLCLLSLAWAYEDLLILQPLSLASEFPNGVEHKPAMFGIPSYASAIEGPLVYATSGIDSNGCTPIPQSEVDTWPTGVRIVMVDRGNCTFVDKVRNVQQAGGAAAVIVDNVVENVIPYMADDGTGSDISIPSVLIGLQDGDTLKQGIIEQAIYGSVLVSLAWTMPHPDGRVEWSLWTSSNDPQSREFKTVFGAVAADLADSVQFTPHFFILDGRLYGCTTEARRCGDQCTADGKYCAHDPDGSLTSGISGLDIVEENLRQMCLFRHLNETGRGLLWWDYASRFIAQCCNPEDLVSGLCDASAWSSACSYDILTQLDIDVSVIQTCEANDLENLMDAELQLKVEQGIFRRPQIIINTAPYQGSLTCNDPINAHTCGPLEGICSGFAAGTAPQTCMGDISCSWGVNQDECGVCGADGMLDACGLCLSPSSPNFNTTCLGCDGIPFSQVVNDQCGICGGTGTFDACGRCFQAGDHRASDDPDNCDKQSSSNTHLYVIIGIGGVCIVLGAYVYHKRQQDHLARIDAVLQSYLPLSDANEMRGGGVAGADTPVELSVN